MSIRVLLVCVEGTAQQEYLRASKELGAQIDIASSLNEFYEAVTRTPYNGLMIDMFTKIKYFSGSEEKTNNILKRYPVLQLTFEVKSGHTRTFYSGLVNGRATIEDFLTRKCLSFDARTMRSDPRKDIIFNVILSKSNKLSDADHERTVTMNVSRVGCFIFSVADWEVNNDAWLIIKELSDQTPIRGQVQRKIDWGISMCIPGIGIKIKDIKDCQLKELCDKSRLKS
ncbi:MAG: hypothetical protein ACYSR0_12070 [Planctomycetota bacterium]|jgi:hypothetical protein